MPKSVSLIFLNPVHSQFRGSQILPVIDPVGPLAQLDLQGSFCFKQVIIMRHALMLLVLPVFSICPALNNAQLVADPPTLANDSGNQIQPPIAVKLPTDHSRFHLFLLAGQSNMAGRGTVEAGDKTIHPRILSLNKNNQWMPAVDPLHFDKPNVVGVGPGKTFAIDYAAKHPDVTVGLIPCAAGGSPISSWKPGGYHNQTQNHPYDDALKRTRVALKSGTLKGILWHQGESDANQAKSVLYEEKLHELIKRFRTDLELPNTPFIAGQMGQFSERPWSDSKKLVDFAHQLLSQKVANCGFAHSDGLSHRGDEVHFDSKAYRTLGHRYFTAFEAISNAKTKFAQ